MTELDDFLAATLARQHEAEQALVNRLTERHGAMRKLIYGMNLTG
jgi:hypothetical protein